jgi:hypothetical protein
MDHLKIISQLKSPIICALPYGSRLYGTSTPSSDYDYKAVYMPTLRTLLLNKELKVERARFHADGTRAADGDSMTADGLEIESFSIHKLFHDYVRGQAYAMELVFAMQQGFTLTDATLTTVWGQSTMATLSKELVAKAPHKNVYSMVSFAVKQTMDYVQRGERLKAASNVLRKVKNWELLLKTNGAVPRLDTMVAYADDTGYGIITERVIDNVARATGLTIGESMNQSKKMDTLKLNGREYLETTRLDHLIGALEKLVESYGTRTNEAAEKDVDWKSLSHAVRVYQQVEEFLDTGFITFPRANVQQLIDIKEGRTSLEDVKVLLRDLDTRIHPRCVTPTQTEIAELDKQADAILYSWVYEATL